ncbi:hypothetical protein BVG19_g910 [[Candida] boidinii]|nr:hypothetical protein BVG19_g910 [[Candida] boidinii]OWB48693.1 hypothetical protein B5S27_g228 [[Candida] boidinii]
MASTPSTHENDALSMFFDNNFVPHAFLDALFSSSLPTTANTRNRTSLYQGAAMGATSKEFASSRALKNMQSKCSALLTHLDYYTNELTKNFESKIEALDESSSVISYSVNNSTLSSTAKDGMVGITRLEYNIESLSSSVNSLLRDLEEVDSKIKEINRKEKSGGADAAVEIEGKSKDDTTGEPDPNQKVTEKSEVIDTLNDLLTIRQRIKSVLELFETATALVTTSQQVDNLSNSNRAPTSFNEHTAHEDITNIDIDSFSNSLAIIEETILEEFHKERTEELVNEKLLSKCDLMISLLPLFDKMDSFYRVYKSFVDFIQVEKKRYLSFKDKQ